MSNVLVVDHNSFWCEQITNLVTSQGLSVVQATHGKEAIAVIEQYQPKLVITDIVIPWLNGYELCAWIKKQPDLATNTRVVICSERDGEFDRYWGLKKGADAYLSKPIQPDEFLRILQQMLAETLSTTITPDQAELTFHQLHPKVCSSSSVKAAWKRAIAI